MKSFRSRSYNLSNKRERKSSAASAMDGNVISTEKSSESSSVGRLVQTSNYTELEVNDSKPQEASTRASLLVYRKLDDQGEEMKDASVNSDISETAQTNIREKESGKCSDDSESDYEERMSEKGCEDGNANTMTSMEFQSKMQDDLENHLEKLSGSDNEEENERKSASEDNSNNVSTPEAKTSLDLDQLEEGNSYTEREIYETQLVQLQRQLVEAMIREQETSEKLKKLENLKLDVLLQQLEEEKAKTSELEDKLEFMKNKAKNSAHLRRSNASRRIKRRSRNLETDVNQKESSLGEADDATKDDNQQEKSADATGPPDDDDTPVFNFDEGHFSAVQPESIKYEEKTEISSRFAFLQEYKKMIVETIVDRVWDFVNEDPVGSKKKDGDGDALSVITLKDNINRCKSGAQPITRFVQPIIDVLTWASPMASVMTLLVYMFAVVYGFLLPLIILMAIFQLTSNYFYASGLAGRLGFKWKEEPPPPDDKKLTDKFQLVLQVAKKVQNALGEVADSLEKIKNLLNWQHPATNNLFTLLFLAFVATSVLDGPTIFRIAGIGAGIKLFIIRPIYTKFPKVKKRYDNLARLWNELPTDADLAKQKKKEFYFSAAAADVEDAPGSPKSPKLKSPKFLTSWTDLCVRMKIPLTENPVPCWEEGYRCTLMTRDKPLTKMKQGKLFLTQNYLCFERYKFGTSKHVIIKLEEIVNAEKYKPVNIMPSTGKSMKVEIKGSYKPYIFGALVTRDELFESLIATCKAAKVPWACEGKY